MLAEGEVGRFFVNSRPRIPFYALSPSSSAGDGGRLNWVTEGGRRRTEEVLAPSSPPTTPPPPTIPKAHSG